jgi:hypothetical protein
MAMNNRFPIYIVSKGRWKRRPTANMLELLGVHYYIIVEEQEYDNYKEVVKGTVLILPKSYKTNYDTFWEDGDSTTGAGAARNYAWDHSISTGFTHHWVLDDNIESLERYNNNLKIKCYSPTPFYIMEDFMLRYKNLAQVSPSYSIFCPASEGRSPLIFNTRCYSFVLIKNSIAFRWRGRYNEDTDLSLRILKSGLCTVEFRTFLQGKRATQTVSGGNTEVFYKHEGTLNKSQMLVEMHPDVTKLTKKFNRWHHHVDYKPFKSNLLVFKEGLNIEEGLNNYDLKLRIND